MGQVLDIIGGLIGDNSITTIENCYAKGDIYGGGYVGGLTGSNSGKIKTSYAFGNLKGKLGYFGGIAGNNSDSGSIENSYYIGEINVEITSDSSTKINDICYTGTITDSKKLTKEEAKNQGSFAGFDFEKIWQMGEESPEFKTSE